MEAEGNEYPDYQTEGYTLDDLKRMLVSLRTDIREMIADGWTLGNNR